MNDMAWWLRGSVELAISEGTRDEDAQRFLSICKSNGICIKDVIKKDGIYSFIISIEDYRKIRKIVKKTHILPKLVNKYGLPFLYSKNKNRQSFVVGLIIGLTLFYIASSYIWNISVVGENYHTESELIDFMRNQGIVVGTKINDIECEKVEKMIRAEYSDIGWVSVQIEGTYLIVSVKENIKYDVTSDSGVISKDKVEKDIFSDDYVRQEDKVISDNNYVEGKENGRYDNLKNDGKKHDIVASEDGIVESIMVRTGEAKVEVGDEVKAGDILISGEVEILNDAAEVVEKKNVCAEGDIYIKYDKEYYYERDRKYKKRCYSDRKRRGIKMYFQNTKFLDVNFYHLLTKKIDNFDIIVNNYNVMLCKNLYTPFRVEKSIWQDYVYEEKIYTDKELENKAKIAFDRYSMELNKDNKDIIYSNVETQVLKDAVLSKGYITIKSKQTSIN